MDRHPNSSLYPAVPPQQYVDNGQMPPIPLAACHSPYQSTSSDLVLPQVSMIPKDPSSADPTEHGQLISPSHDIAVDMPSIDKDNHAPDVHDEHQDAQITDDGEKYDWKWLCMPRMPWGKPGKAPPFFGIHAKLPIPLALVMGFQHALAMMGGIITPPLLVSGANNARFSNSEIQYILAAGLICSGILSFTQIYQLKLWRGYVLGTGFISVVGTSFTFLPIAQTAIAYQMSQDSTRSCSTDADCPLAWAGQSGAFAGQSVPGLSNLGQCNTATSRCKYSGQEAYGAFIGTAMVCSLVQMGLSFVPKRQLRRVLPPVVTGVCVMLIGIGLLSSSFTAWGGGTFCAEHADKRMVTLTGRNIPGNVVNSYPSTSPCAINGACEPFKGSLSGVCAYTPPSYDAVNDITIGDSTVCDTFMDLPGVFPATPDPSKSFVMCGGNGDVQLPFGSAPYVGLGMSVFVMLVLIEIFGSPFMRNCQVAIALIFGYILAAAIPYNVGVKNLHYVNSNAIDSAPWVTFLWVHTFPLSFSPASLVPLLICYLVCSIECVGDITASAEASRVAASGPEFDARMQGGLLVDGLNSCVACLATSMPSTTYAQNNGVIALTRCASKRAGYACCFWLLLLGVLAKFSAVITSIPDAVLGGMTSFLFVNVVVSGIRRRILGKEHPPSRRSRFIASASLSLGIGVALAPGWATNNLWQWNDPNNQVGQLFHDSIIIVLSTPYCIGTIAALILNALIPEDLPDPVEVDVGNTPSSAATVALPAAGAAPSIVKAQESFLFDARSAVA